MCGATPGLSVFPFSLCDFTLILEKKFLLPSQPTPHPTHHPCHWAVCRVQKAQGKFYTQSYPPSGYSKWQGPLHYFRSRELRTGRQCYLPSLDQGLPNTVPPFTDTALTNLRKNLALLLSFPQKERNKIPLLENLKNRLEAHIYLGWEECLLRPCYFLIRNPAEWPLNRDPWSGL